MASDQRAALLAEIYARPDDDDARLVLADLLLANADPRGELIALQLAPPTPAKLARIERLLREHGKAWLGPLRAVAHRARFERGFVARLELDGRWAASEDAWAQHASDPALATVEDLIPGRAVGATYARFVASPAMTALRRIEVYDRPTLEALRTTHAHLVHVAVPRWKAGKYVHELAANVLPACARFAALRSLAIYVDGAPSLLASSVLPRLASLTVAGSLARGLALWPHLPTTTSLTIARSAVLDDCAVTRVAWAGALQLARTDDGVVAHASGAWLIGELVPHLAALPALRRLEIAGTAPRVDSLIAAAERRGIQVVLAPAARRTGYVAGLDARRAERSRSNLDPETSRPRSGNTSPARSRMRRA